MMRGEHILNPSQGPYLRAEQQSPQSGLLSTDNNPQGTALENALQNRRQKLAEKKIGLFPEPGEQDIQ